MDIRHCPACGAENISHSTSSFEYGRSTTWECNACDWHYTKGSGIGTGTGNSGTHPREYPRWCAECQTTFPSRDSVNAHVCTLTEIWEKYDETPLPYDELKQELSDYHSDHRINELVEDAIQNGTVKVVLRYSPKLAPREREERDEPHIAPPARTTLHDQVIDLIADYEPIHRGEIASKLGIDEETPWASTYLQQVIAELYDWNEINLSHGQGLTLADS